MNPVARMFMDRVNDAVSSNIDLSHLSEWIVRNTTHPKDSKRKWSFLHHEFQIDVLNDSARRLSLKKCSQVGVSEVFVRLILALLAVKQNHTAIYTLPTTGFANKFSKSRLDPVIDTSQMLTNMVSKDNDSASLKQIGMSFLHITGTFTQGAAISTPADILINDEVDFSDQTVLTTYASRLGHAEAGGLRREFSTPTVGGFGISKIYKASSQARYFVKCDSCRQWVAPDFFADVVLPGFDDDLIKFEKEDFKSGRYDLNKAYVACPSCRDEITVRNLADPEKRQWIHAFPDNEHHGYHVVPFDVASINPPGKTLAQIDEYERKADWVNFKVGYEYEDAETSIVKSILDRAFLAAFLTPRMGAATGCVLGMDVGKTCHLLIGRRSNARRMDVIYAERIRQDGQGNVQARVLQLIEWFGVVKAVIDAGPDFSIALNVIDNAFYGVAWGNYYARSIGAALSNIKMDEGQQIVTSLRTGTLDHTVKEVNSGKVLFCKCAEEPLMIEHFTSVKRIVRQDASGKDTAYWVSSGPDHYAHALNYLMIADELNDKASALAGFGVLPLASKVKLKTGEES